MTNTMIERTGASIRTRRTEVNDFVDRASGNSHGRRLTQANPRFLLNDRLPLKLLLTLLVSRGD